MTKVQKNTHVSEESLFDATFDDTRCLLRVVADELGRNDRSRDGLGGVDNLLDTRHTERDVHRGDTGEMESLERHLRTGLTDRLRTDSADSRTFRRVDERQQEQRNARRKHEGAPGSTLDLTYLVQHSCRNSSICFRVTLVLLLTIASWCSAGARRESVSS
jgi:hypothetical protein